jgi:hypothetical protein
MLLYERNFLSVNKIGQIYALVYWILRHIHDQDMRPIRGIFEYIRGVFYLGNSQVYPRDLLLTLGNSPVYPRDHLLILGNSPVYPRDLLSTLGNSPVYPRDHLLTLGNSPVYPRDLLLTLGNSPVYMRIGRTFYNKVLDMSMIKIWWWCLLNINYNMVVGYKIYLHTNTDQPERYKYKMKSIRKIYDTYWILCLKWTRYIIARNCGIQSNCWIL